MNDLNEDIKILEKLISIYQELKKDFEEGHASSYEMQFEDFKAIENLLKRYKELEEENNQLKVNEEILLKTKGCLNEDNSTNCRVLESLNYGIRAYEKTLKNTVIQNRINTYKEMIEERPYDKAIIEIHISELQELKDIDFNLPIRKTKKSAGYDFECIETITIPPYKLGDKPVLVPTGIKCKMQDDEFLMLVNRSSNPKKKNLVIPNSMGIIDADYYGNPDNDGEMMFTFYNLGTEPVTIEKGYAVGQGIFQKYYVTDDDVAEGERLGGFGSTSK